MRVAQLIESTPFLIELGLGEAQALRKLGATMASNRQWWGARKENESEERSVIRVEAMEDALFRVTVLNMMGVLRLPGLQLQIAPKIPLPHFLHLISRCELAPRSANATIEVDASFALLEVLARWFLDESEKLLRNGLRPDYKSTSDELDAVRGDVDPCATMLSTLRGRAIAVCTFDELSHDAPLNRLVHGACQRAASLPMLSPGTRTRARAVAYRMDGVGPVQAGDFRVVVDRVSQRYAVAVSLARLILQGLGISIDAGSNTGMAFLLRTPELIESGMRAIVSAALSDVVVEPGRLMLAGTGLSMNPDLVFGRAAVGDVKYKLLSSFWARGDLYQSIAFATAYQCDRSVVFGFVADADVKLPPSVRAGTVTVTALAWDADSARSPMESEERFRAAVARWYEETASSA